MKLISSEFELEFETINIGRNLLYTPSMCASDAVSIKLNGKFSKWQTRGSLNPMITVDSDSCRLRWKDE